LKYKFYADYKLCSLQIVTLVRMRPILPIDRRYVRYKLFVLFICVVFLVS